MKECLFNKCTIGDLYNTRHDLKDQKLNHAIAIVEGPDDLASAEIHDAEIQRLQGEIDRLSQQIANCLMCANCSFSEVVEIESGRLK